MSFLSDHLVSVVVFLPLLFAAVVAFLPKDQEGAIRGATFTGMALTLAAAVWMYLRFEARGAEFQLEERHSWMPDFGVSYHVGVDGLAVTLMLLTAFLGPLVVTGSVTYIHERRKEFHLALLVLQTAMLGTFAALDVVLFYVFWEAMLIPMYLLVGVWGSEDRIAAAVKFFLYTLVGSFLMLVAILALYFISQQGPVRSFDLAAIYNSLLPASQELARCLEAGAACGELSTTAQALKTYGPWLFAAFALAFAIKVPMFPVHTWLPDAHVQAPMAGSMILAGVMLKAGTFGFWRYAFPLFPTAARDLRLVFAVLAVVGIVYGALMCLAQRDIKKLIAYSSVSHLGYCMLGMVAVTSEGAAGSAYQMVNHGVTTGALFLLFGFLYERRHTRLIADYGGIAKVMPLFTAFFLVATFASIAVPGTNGFIGEFLVLLGTFKSPAAGGVWLGAVASLGVILGAAYMLWMVQRVFFGPLSVRENQGLSDLGGREVATALPFIVLAIGMGVWPQPFLDRLAPSVERFVARARVADPGVDIPDSHLRMDVKALAREGGPGQVVAEARQ